MKECICEDQKKEIENEMRPMILILPVYHQPFGFRCTVSCV